MKKEAYIAAMQKVEISDDFMKKTARLLQAEADRVEEKKDDNTLLLRYSSLVHRRIGAKERLKPTLGKSVSTLQPQLSDTKKSTIKMRLILKLAAGIFILLLSTAGITAAASGVNVVDLFKGFFKEPVKQENGMPDNMPGKYNITVTAAPLKEDSAFIQKASAVIQASTQANGLKLTARGVVGDSHNLFIAVDVETEDGSAFNPKQQSEVEGLSFNNVWLLVNDNALGQYCYITRVDDSSEPGKATFVLRNSMELTDLSEDINHIQLSFTNLIQPSTEAVIDIGAQKNVLEIMNELGEAPPEDFNFMGPRFKTKEDIDWYIDKREQIGKELEEKGEIDRSKKDYDSLYGKQYEILEKLILERGMIPKYSMRRTKKQLTFCSKYPKLAISNIGILNNQLCAKFELNDDISFESFRDARIIMINKKTGNIIRGIDEAGAPVNGDDESQADFVNGKIISCSAQFSGITSKEELKDYYFAFGGMDFSYQTLYEGEWKLDFDLSYTDTTREYDVSEDFTFDGHRRRLTGISVSPISLQLKFKTSAEDKNITAETTDIIKIIMEDNSEVVINQYSWDEEGLNAVLPYVIDIDKIKAVDMNGSKIEL